MSANRLAVGSMVLLALGCLLVPVSQAQGDPVSGIIAELAFGLGVDRDTRELQDPGSAFSGDAGKIFCLAHVTGMADPGQVTFAWYHEGKTLAKVPLPIRSADYRTWSSKNIMPAWTGAWEVKLLDDAGRVLASAAFTVE